MACGSAYSRNCGNGAGARGWFDMPNFAGRDFSGFAFGLPFSPEVAAAGLRNLLSDAAPFLQNIIDQIDAEIIKETIRMSMEEQGKIGQFKEVVKVDRKGNKYGVGIVLGSGIQSDSLKISRKDRVVTLDVKIEKKAADGSESLYQEYTRKITLPEDVDLSQLESSLSPEGVLSLSVPFIPKLEESKPNSIKIPVLIEEDKNE